MNLQTWMEEYSRRMEDAFGERIRFIGLQGSRARGEGRDDSDIDVVCILDKLFPEDVYAYRDALDGIEHRELVCGFLGGWDELMHWEPAELFQFYHDTTAFIGNLDELLKCIDEEAVARAVRIGAGTIYHGCVHNMVHGKNAQVLRELYKAAGFVLRASTYLRSEEYVRRNDDLLTQLETGDQEILKTHMALKDGAEADFNKMSDELFVWSQKYLKHK